MFNKAAKTRLNHPFVGDFDVMGHWESGHKQDRVVMEVRYKTWWFVPHHVGQEIINLCWNSLREIQTVPPHKIEWIFTDSHGHHYTVVTSVYKLFGVAGPKASPYYATSLIPLREVLYRDYLELPTLSEEKYNYDRFEPR